MGCPSSQTPGGLLAVASFSSQVWGLEPPETADSPRGVRGHLGGTPLSGWPWLYLSASVLRALDDKAER